MRSYMKKTLTVSAAAALSLILVQGCAQAQVAKAATVTPLGTGGPNFGLGTTFTTAPQTADASFMLYVEVDPGTVTVTSVTEPDVKWTQAEYLSADGRQFYLFHGVASKTGRTTATVKLSGTYTGAVELGWQQFTGPTSVAQAGSLTGSTTDVEFPSIGAGYLWEYGKATAAAACNTGTPCYATPQDNVVLSGEFSATPAPEVQTGGSGYVSVGARLVP